MKTKSIQEAKDEDLRNSLAALQRASKVARQTALQTGTHLVLNQDGKLLLISADQMRKVESVTRMVEDPLTGSWLPQNVPVRNR